MIKLLKHLWTSIVWRTPRLLKFVKSPAAHLTSWMQPCRPNTNNTKCFLLLLLLLCLPWISLLPVKTLWQPSKTFLCFAATAVEHWTGINVPTGKRIHSVRLTPKTPSWMDIALLFLKWMDGVGWITGMRWGKEKLTVLIKDVFCAFLNQLV